MASALQAAVTKWKYPRDNPQAPGASAQSASDESVMTRIGGSKTTRRKTASENAAIAAFDRSMGLGATDAAGTLKQHGKSTGLGAVDAQGNLRQEAYSENSTGTFGSGKVPGQQPPAPPAVGPVNRTDGLRSGVNTSPVPVAASVPGLDQAGGSLGGPLAAVTQTMGPFNRSAQFAPNPDKPPTTLPAPTLPTPIPSATPSVTPSVSSAGTPGPVASALPSAPAPTPGTMALTPNPPYPVSPTPETGGKSIASGVSNSQAAGFDQATNQKPVPTTPTSPVMDVNDYDKRKVPFSGF